MRNYQKTNDWYKRPLLEIGAESNQTNWIVTNKIYMKSWHQELSNDVCGCLLGMDCSRAIPAGLNKTLCAWRAPIYGPYPLLIKRYIIYLFISNTSLYLLGGPSCLVFNLLIFNFIIQLPSNVVLFLVYIILCYWLANIILCY